MYSDKGNFKEKLAYNKQYLSNRYKSVAPKYRDLIVACKWIYANEYSLPLPFVAVSFMRLMQKWPRGVFGLDKGN